MSASNKRKFQEIAHVERTPLTLWRNSSNRKNQRKRRDASAVIRSSGFWEFSANVDLSSATCTDFPKNTIVSLTSLRRARKSYRRKLSKFPIAK